MAQPIATVSEHHGGLAKAYLQLVRLPNVFTAIADILLGFLITHPLADVARDDWIILALLVGSSSALYTAGMVLNDLFDFEVDARERPHRPLPSGRIHPSKARRLGIALLMIGVALAWMINVVEPLWRPAIVATALAGLIVVYDAALRRTPLGPLALGGCRTLNVLLGMSAAAFAWHPAHFVIAAGVGLYIFGVSWFAMNEAQISHRLQLALAMLAMLAGIALLALYPRFIDADYPDASRPNLAAIPRWQLLMAVLGGMIAWRCLQAIRDPAPGHVQMVVKYSIMSLIVLDAAVCFTIRGFAGAIPILILLVPTLLLGRWIYST